MTTLTAINPGDDWNSKRPIPQSMCSRISELMNRSPKDEKAARAIALEWGIEWKD
jgi:hypothetical protein